MKNTHVPFSFLHVLTPAEVPNVDPEFDELETLKVGGFELVSGCTVGHPAACPCEECTDARNAIIEANVRARLAMGDFEL